MATSSNPLADNAVHPRRIAFSYPDGGLNHLFVQGDLVMSHAIAVLSAMFPEGEDFFIKSVKRYAERVTDPQLKQQVKGFIGQEVTHGREHRVLNDRLRAMGYPTRLVDRFVHHLMFNTERILPIPARFQLAVTASLEHYTATVAERLLTSESARELLGDSEVRSMLLWHALEESEHKAVAFDVYRATGGSERLRIAVMYLVNALFFPIVVGLTALSMIRDRATYNPIRLVKSLLALRRSPFLARPVIDHLRAYNHPGFHPNDVDSTDLLEAWRGELFGADGILTDHLK